MGLNTPEKVVIIVSVFYLILAVISTGFTLSLAWKYGIFFVFSFVTLYISYLVITNLYPKSLGWDGVIWAAVLAVATYVIIAITMLGLVWAGFDPMGPCGPGMLC